MTVVLPNEIEGLSALENNLEQLLTPQDLDYQRVAVKLPSFLIESEYPLKPILQRVSFDMLQLLLIFALTYFLVGTDFHF